MCEFHSSGQRFGSSEKSPSHFWGGEFFVLEVLYAANVSVRLKFPWAAQDEFRLKARPDRV
jgi:hypothetical protein